MNAELPPMVHSLLVELLSYAKLDWTGLRGQSNGMNVESTTFDEVRLAVGYTDQYALYFTIVVILAIVLSLAQVIFGNSLKCCNR